MHDPLDPEQATHKYYTEALSCFLLDKEVVLGLDR